MNLKTTMNVIGAELTIKRDHKQRTSGHQVTVIVDHVQERKCGTHVIVGDDVCYNHMNETIKRIGLELEMRTDERTMLRRVVKLFGAW